jgi:N-acetylglucosamine kinase-like BadF-type ATPase
MSEPAARGDAPLAVPAGLPGRVLGIDAGGSATRVVCVAGGKVTALPPAPPMNALLTGQVLERLEQIIRPAGATAAGIGLPGLRSRERASDLAAALSRRTGCRVTVTSDLDTARAGAFLGGPGTVVIAGTGSAAFGSDGQRSARAGGHGFLLGDEGSAYWIGRAAAQAALRWEDGTGGSALLHRAVTQAAGCGLDELIRRIHARPAERDPLALLAPVVTALADADPEAQRIASDAAGQLASLAGAVQRTTGPLPVAGAGGVFRAPAIWLRFAASTGATRPLAPAAVGAALLAGTEDQAVHE